MKARTLCLIMMVMVFGLANMVFAAEYAVSTASIQNLYQEILSAKSFSSLAAQGGATERYSSGDKVRFQPILTNINIAPGNVKYYAGYTEGDKIYLAQKGADGNIIFKALGKETEIPYYDTDYFYGGTWTPDAYFELLGDSFGISGKTFIFGIAPSSVKTVADFTQKFYGQWISLTKGSTVTPTDPQNPDPGNQTGSFTITACASEQVLCNFGGGRWMIDMTCSGKEITLDQCQEKICTVSGGKWTNKQCTGAAEANLKANDSLFCAFSGGKFSDNKCIATPGQPYYVDPATACNSSGGAWSNGQCINAEADHLKLLCENSFGSWVNDRCHHPLLCTSIENWDPVNNRCVACTADQHWDTNNSICVTCDPTTEHWDTATSACVAN